MVRILRKEVLVEDKMYIEAAGKVGDTKPAGNWAQCSSYLELDTTNKKLTAYFWDEDSASWIDVSGGDS